MTASWPDHVAAAEEMGVSHQEAYETFDGPLAQLRRKTLGRLQPRPCRRCGFDRPPADLREVDVPTPDGPQESLKLELCAKCRLAVKEAGA